MKGIANFISGFRPVQENYFSKDRELSEQLRHGQRPKTAIIASADSRIDPVLLMGADPERCGGKVKHKLHIAPLTGSASSAFHQRAGLP